MFALIQQLIGGSGTGEKLDLAVTVDHVELSTKHLVLGLKLDWLNRTSDSIRIQDVGVMVYLDGRKKEPLRFFPLERFARAQIKREIQKTAIRPFTLPPDAIYTEQIRFISQEVLDIPPGTYAMDVQLMDTDNTSYLNRVKFPVEGKVKYRRSEEWQLG
jgi:hypothetical protein